MLKQLLGKTRPTYSLGLSIPHVSSSGNHALRQLHVHVRVACSLDNVPVQSNSSCQSKVILIHLTHLDGFFKSKTRIVRPSESSQQCGKTQAVPLVGPKALRQRGRRRKRIENRVKLFNVSTNKQIVRSSRKMKLPFL
jgi:hypothetical protein